MSHHSTELWWFKCKTYTFAVSVRPHEKLKEIQILICTPLVHIYCKLKSFTSLKTVIEVAKTKYMYTCTNVYAKFHKNGQQHIILWKF